MKEKSREDIFFQWVVNILAIIIGAVTLYPLIYVVSASLSSPTAIYNGDVFLFPVKLNINAYLRVFKSQDILTGYKNTIIYAFGGTTISMIMTIMAAYPLAQRNLKGRDVISIMILFTMFFSGGMIPNYINLRNLKLLNTPWAILVPGTISATNMIIMRNYFQHSIPGDLHEAAKIDGSSALGTMLRIILPLSKPILVVITLYYFVGEWNAYTGPLLYLKDRKMWPLQVYLRQILVNSDMGDMAEVSGESDSDLSMLYASLRYAVIVVSAVPLLVIYPMIQRFFQKGIMMGSLKG